MSVNAASTDPLLPTGDIGRAASTLAGRLMESKTSAEVAERWLAATRELDAAALARREEDAGCYKLYFQEGGGELRHTFVFTADDDATAVAAISPRVDGRAAALWHSDRLVKRYEGDRTTVTSRVAR